METPKESHPRYFKNAMVTGSAGFVGFHVSKRLLDEGWEVYGIDGLTPYYDINLKKKRNQILSKFRNYRFYNKNLEDSTEIMKIFEEVKPSIVIHLAAQAGVRNSSSDPRKFMDSNLTGTFNVLEASKKIECHHFLMASSSSVYGKNESIPHKETDRTDFPISFYAATKKSAEILTYSYSHLYNIPTTCFRFFTVYGPWGRPDMALFKFTDLIFNDLSIDVYNFGKMERDFTYIDDLVEGVWRLIDVVPERAETQSESKNSTGGDQSAPWRAINIGRGKPETLEKILQILEENIGIKIKKNYVDIQPGDVPITFADNTLLKSLTNFQPKTRVEDGIRNFVNWYKEHYSKTINKH